VAIQGPSLYHGDEIEVSGNDTVWTAKKALRVVKYSGFFNWHHLFFFLELKVDNPDVPSFAGVFIDGAEEPIIEIPVSATEYELFFKHLNIGNWKMGIYSAELKLKSTGTTIHNRLFEIWIG